MKSKRQEKILELIEKYNIETQEELIARLAECGIESKQTTVSRDIKELYLYKEPIGGGRSRYAVSGKADHIDNTKRLKLILNECSVGVDYAGIVVLLKTLPGLADAAGAAIDAMKLPDMLGLHLRATTPWRSSPAASRRPSACAMICASTASERERRD